MTTGPRGKATAAPGMAILTVRRPFPHPRHDMNPHPRMVSTAARAAQLRAGAVQPDRLGEHAPQIVGVHHRLVAAAPAFHFQLVIELDQRRGRDLTGHQTVRHG